MRLPPSPSSSISSLSLPPSHRWCYGPRVLLLLATDTGAKSQAAVVPRAGHFFMKNVAIFTIQFNSILCFISHRAIQCIRIFKLSMSLINCTYSLLVCSHTSYQVNMMTGGGIFLEAWSRNSFFVARLAGKWLFELHRRTANPKCPALALVPVTAPVGRGDVTPMTSKL